MHKPQVPWGWEDAQNPSHQPRSLGLSHDRKAVRLRATPQGTVPTSPWAPRSSRGGTGLERAKALSLEREAIRGWATRGLHATATPGPGEPAQPPPGQVQSTMACRGACVHSHGHRHREPHPGTPKHVGTFTHVLLTISCGSLLACHHLRGHTPTHTCPTLSKHSVTPPPVQLTKGASVPSALHPEQEAWGSLCPLSLCPAAASWLGSGSGAQETGSRASVEERKSALPPPSLLPKRHARKETRNREGGACCSWGAGEGAQGAGMPLPPASVCRAKGGRPALRCGADRGGSPGRKLLQLLQEML